MKTQHIAQTCIARHGSGVGRWALEVIALSGALWRFAYRVGIKVSGIMDKNRCELGFVCVWVCWWLSLTMVRYAVSKPANVTTGHLLDASLFLCLFFSLLPPNRSSELRISK